MKTKVLIKKLNPKVTLPEYKTHGSSGLDLQDFIEKDIIISPGKSSLIPTGLSVAISEDLEIQIRPRSGLALKNGITVLNTPGTIDADYRGEIKVILVNLSNNEFIIKNGERICQMVIAKHETINWDQVEILEETVRGAGGFGHTGKH